MQGLPGWSSIFVQYFQVLRLLTSTRQAATEPRLCDALAAVMQACAGRLQELHQHLVRIRRHLVLAVLSHLNVRSTLMAKASARSSSMVERRCWT